MSNPYRSDTSWFRQAGWGALSHYLVPETMSAEEWNRQVDGFDVDALADQLAAAGAPYYFVTIGQNSGHYCSPNATYDEIVGIEPSKCSRRDLIADLAGALAERDIRLLVYLPSGAPNRDPVAVEKLRWKWGFAEAPANEGFGRATTAERLAGFQRLWERIIREWSERWGRRVHGWWIDGCYFAADMYDHPEEPNWASLTRALKAGNPDAIVAYNPGVRVPVISQTEYEDFTAGEVDGNLPVSTWRGDGNRFGPPPAEIGGAQYHVLTFLGRRWGGGEPRFGTDLVAAYTRYVNGFGGVITWDVPIAPDGALPTEFTDQLAAVADATERT